MIAGAVVRLLRPARRRPLRPLGRRPHGAASRADAARVRPREADRGRARVSWAAWSTSRFSYDTGDAAGQNMTTSCTWHACQWLMRQIEPFPDIRARELPHRGAMSGDKKVSFQAFISGRGTRVTAECFLARAVVSDVLKVTPEQVLRPTSVGSPEPCKPGRSAGTSTWPTSSRRSSRRRDRTSPASTSRASRCSTWSAPTAASTPACCCPAWSSAPSVAERTCPARTTACSCMDCAGRARRLGSRRSSPATASRSTCRRLAAIARRTVRGRPRAPGPESARAVVRARGPTPAFFEPGLRGARRRHVAVRAASRATPAAGQQHHHSS